MKEMVSTIVLLTVGGGLLTCLAKTRVPTETEIAGFATSLKGRTSSQRDNAQRAAKSLDGVIVPPGSVFSFNQVVKSWSQDRGYVKAPVSYDGELIKAFGGGVCQTSTTLYNAVLLAGLPILERHPHVFAPHYVPPGRDAAVAQRNIDLRFKNTFAWPIRIKASADGDRLDIRLYGRERPGNEVRIGTEALSATEPARLTRVVQTSSERMDRAYVRNPGVAGYRILSYRSFWRKGVEIRRERLADDSYEAMDRVVQLNEEAQP